MKQALRSGRNRFAVIYQVDRVVTWARHRASANSSNSLNFLREAFRLVRRIIYPIGVALEARRLLRQILRGRGSGVKVLIDWELRKTAPTVGDTIGGLVLARVLSKMGYSVTFAVDYSTGMRFNWYFRSESERLWMVNTWLEILAEFNAEGSAIRVVEINDSDKRNEEFKSHDLVFRSVFSLWKVVPKLVSLLWQNKKLTGSERDGFLLDSLKYSDSELRELGIFGPFLTWHVRFAAHDSRRNPTDEEVIDIFARITSEFPRHKIVILSNSTGVARVMRIVDENPVSVNASAQLMPQPDNDFVSAMRLLLSSQAYIQHLGGGIGVVGIYSRVPMFLSLFHEGAYPPVRGKKIMPWSSTTQHFVKIGSDRRYEEELSEWLATDSR